MDEQELDEIFSRLSVAAKPERLKAAISIINTAGFALAFMSGEPESLSEILLNLKVILSSLVEDA